MAKNVSYRGKKEINPAEGKIPYDSSVWQAREGGDYIHTLTGEIREEDQFDFEATAAVDGENSDATDEDGSGFASVENDWDAGSQDAVGDDFVAAQVKVSRPSSGEEAEGEATNGKSKTGGKGKSKKR